MEKYTEKQFLKLVRLKKKIVESHKKCKGVGYLKSVKNPCECMKVFVYVKELVYSQIPIDYWMLNLKDLNVDITYKKVVEQYIKNIDNAIEQGLGIMFLGDRGIGKTSLGVEICKEAIAKRYNVFYELAQKIVKDEFTEEKRILKRIEEADLIFIDEFDKVAMRENSNIPKQIENLLRELLPNGKSIIISTNYSDHEIEETFRITSLIKRYIELMPMEGEDYSEKKQKEWKKKLKDNSLNFFCDNILNMANKFYENENIAEEKEYDKLF